MTSSIVLLEPIKKGLSVDIRASTKFTKKMAISKILVHRSPSRSLTPSITNRVTYSLLHSLTHPSLSMSLLGFAQIGTTIQLISDVAA